MVTTRNSLDKLTAGVSTRADLLSYFNSNLDIIDAAVAKCNFVGVDDPDGDDDEADGYAVGSAWYNVTGHKIFLCEDATEGAAVWYQVYPSYSSLWAVQEEPSGTKNGSNKSFTLANTPIGTVVISFNGLEQKNGVDYSNTGTALTLITFAPESDDWLSATYQY